MPNIFDPTIPNNPPQGIQAQLDLLYLYNPDVANKLIEQLRAGLIEITDLVAEVQKALADLQGVLRYKGSVETYDDLPTEGNVTGDVWNVIDTDINVAWDGEKWDKFGSAIDTSSFLQNRIPTTGGLGVTSGGGSNIIITNSTSVPVPPSYYKNNIKIGANVGSIGSSDSISIGTGTDINDSAVVIGNNAYSITYGGGVSIGKSAISYGGGVTIGYSAYTHGVGAIAIGKLAKSSNTDGLSIAFGHNAIVSAYGAIALGAGATNDEAGTFKVCVGNKDARVMATLLDATGHIPSESLVAGGTTGQVLSKTDDGMAWTDMTGGISEIVHDATLSGSGTVESPLKVADDTYLPLSGGKLSGDLVAPQVLSSRDDATPVLSLRADTATEKGTPVVLEVTPQGSGLRVNGNISALYLTPRDSRKYDLGSSLAVWQSVYVTKINNGADIAVPTEGGTLARVEDINAAVGDIASALDTISGESV